MASVSTMGVRSGMPYTAAVELKTIRLTPVVPQRFQQGDPAGHVLAEVLGWVHHRLADERFGGAMEYRLDAVPVSNAATAAVSL